MENAFITRLIKYLAVADHLLLDREKIELKIALPSG